MSEELPNQAKLGFVELLANSPAFAFFLSEIAKDKVSVEQVLGATTDPVLLAKASGSLKSLNMVLNLCNELKEELTYAARQEIDGRPEM